MLWKVIGTISLFFTFCTLLWYLWTENTKLSRTAFWIIIAALVICIVDVIKGMIAE